MQYMKASMTFSYKIRKNESLKNIKIKCLKSNQNVLKCFQ